MSDAKQLFELAGEMKLYDFALNYAGKSNLHFDDIVAVALELRDAGDQRARELFCIIKDASSSDFVDEYYYRCLKYEAEVRSGGVPDRIEYLCDLLDYSFEKSYALELGCLYIEQNQASKARRLVSKVTSLYGVFDEADLILSDADNGTNRTRILLDQIASYAIDARFNDIVDTDASAESDGPVLAIMSEEASPEKNDTSSIVDEYFDGLVGMDSVRQQLDRIYRRLIIEQIRADRLGVDASEPKGLNFILYGNPGTGKTTVARIIGKLLNRIGLLEKDDVVETDRSGLVAEHIGGTEQRTREKIEEARGATLFVDEAYALYREDSQNDFGREAIDVLLKDIEDHRGEYCVILAGYKEPMRNMIKKANVGFSSRFNYQIEIDDYTADELVQIMELMASKQHYCLNDAAKAAVVRRIEREKIDDSFDNARFIRRLLDEGIEHLSLRLSDAGSFRERDLTELKAEDFQGEIEVQKSVDDYLAELDELIGLDPVKNAINDFVTARRVAEEERRRGIAVSNAASSSHMAFTGSPGTGKTTVARIVGNILGALGTLKRPDVFIEAGRQDLVGQYQGHTAAKVKDTVGSALGGVLFIDEAYNLVNGEHDDFGNEAVATLIAEMENNRDNLMVILAGYTNEIELFMETNPGIKSRLAATIEFPDYTVEELTQIMELTLKKRGFAIGISGKELHDFIDANCHVKDFGNGRGVRNLADRVVRNRNKRLSEKINAHTVGDEEFLTLIAEDFK